MAMVIGKLPIQPNAKAPMKVTKAPIMLIIGITIRFLPPVAIAQRATTTYPQLVHFLHKYTPREQLY